MAYHKSNYNNNLPAENERIFSTTGMSKETSPSPLSKAPQTKDSYWFAHSKTGDASPVVNDPKSGGDTKDQQGQKDKEEKIRQFREMQEEERVKRMRELEQQFQQAKKHREQQEEERRRRIEEARVKELERRQQVEERKRQIWEAEQERKEAILRRNMEREARIEARRNAQRNSQSYVFGSSTPRTFDLDLAAIGMGRSMNAGSVLMSSVSRRSEEHELGPPPRATSACSLDRKFGEDCMSRSMVSLSSSTFRGRKRTDIMPTLTRERSITPHVTPRGKDTSRSPSRPQSSMSGTSELSTASSSAVNMRHRPAPRRPRPYSVHGSIVDSSSVSAHYTKKEPERPARLTERNTSAPKPERAKSANRENSEIKNTKPLTAPKKPIPPPKPVDVAAKAKPHPVPIKDNLRKRGKPPSKPATDENKVPIDKNENSLASSEKKVEQEKVGASELKEDLPVTDTKPGSAVTSPTTDSDMMLVSSDDSKISAVMGSDMDTLSQSVTESDRYVQESTVASLSESQNASINVTNNESEVAEDQDNTSQSIPNKAQLIELELETPSQSLQKDVKSESPSQTQQIENPPLAQQKEAKPEIPPRAQQKDVKAEIPSQTQQKEVKSEFPSQMQTSFSENMPVPSKPRITSEEEAKAALAEKRRLAREQAEREAELERQRLEELRRQEEEQRRLEEEEQRRMEEEQIRLAELHRQIEQEKLAKAIEEQKRREKEEQEKREEEARQKAEREEQERKAREEAEKQRLELQEKLRKEEEERAERKRRVEQIMARTRGRAATTAQSPSNPPSDNSFKPAQNAESPSVNSSSSSEVSKVTSIITNGVKDLSLGKSTSLNGTSGNHVSSFNSRSFSEAKQVSNNNPLPDILNSENIAKSNGTMVVTDEQSSKISVSNSFDLLSNRTLSANEDKSPQTNGYSSHEEMSCTTSPEENADVGLLIDIQSNQQRSYKSESADFTKLVDVEPTSLGNNVNNENYLINVDDVNSNLFNSGNPFVGFEDSLQKKQDTSVTDLLS